MIGMCVCKKDMQGKRPVGYIGMLSRTRNWFDC